ncbi:MAG: D-alanyl-D-alanine carboxypeptidase [Clostridia bacterium]|nr:D-alanyl-D-alanine carboxypeptidase [Clostridia bacterium]
MFKKIFCIFFVVILIISVTVIPSSAYTPTNFEVEAEGAMLVNMDTGDILYTKNADKRLYPASLTKLMTALVLYENTKDLDAETVTVSKYAINSLQGTDSSTGGLKVDEVLTVRQMLYVLLMSSANEGANAIAEHVAGTIPEFCKKMNAKASQLGMSSTHYVNAHGLHDVEHYTTVNDMYKLTTTILSIDALKEIVNTAQYKLAATNKNPSRTLTTTNFLMLNNGQKCISEKYRNQTYYYKYAKGIKTGYTDAAGRCLISTASKGGYNYMCILMNSPVYENGRKIRVEFGDSKALYEWAFNDFEYKTVLNTEEIVGEAPVDLAWDTDYVSAVPEDSLSTIVPKVADNSTVSLDITWYQDTYSAPITKGEVLGECDVVYAGEVLGTVSIVASQDVERSTLMYIGRGLGNFFSTVFGHWAFYLVLGIIAAIIIVFIISLVILNSPKHKKKKKNRRY